MRSSFRVGFTLIEILAVVLIIGIAAAVIVPQIGTRDDLRVSAASRIVHADIMWAQNRAIVTQRPHYIQFSSGQYQLMSNDVDTDPLSVIEHPVQKASYVVKFGSAASLGMDDVTLGGWSVGGEDTLMFDELGSPHAYDSGSGASTALGAAATVQLDAGAESLTVRVEPFTGEISVQ